MKKLTPNELQILVNKRGYDVFPVKQDNVLFKMWIWEGEKSREGKIEYKCWKDGVNQTNKIIYLNYIK